MHPVGSVRAWKELGTWRPARYRCSCWDGLCCSVPLGRLLLSAGFVILFTRTEDLAGGKHANLACQGQRARPWATLDFCCFWESSERSIVSIAIAVGVAIFYGGLLWSINPQLLNPRLSWEAHPFRHSSAGPAAHGGSCLEALTK